MDAKNYANGTYKVLICDLIGLKFDEKGEPDPGEVRQYIEGLGEVFHLGGIQTAATFDAGRIHFFYQPNLSTEDELLTETSDGRYDAVIAAATVIPKQSVFSVAGVRIGAGTGNMQSSSWGGGDGRGGNAVLMNTPGINSRATAQMAIRALLRFTPDLPFDTLHHLVMAGSFDTGRDLRSFPTEKADGKRLTVFGYGNIGREVARLGKAFGMSVTVYAREHHRDKIEAEGFHFSGDAAAAASGANAISVHVGLGSFDPQLKQYGNAGFIGDEILSAMADGGVLINFDRGEVVDVAALDRAMARGKIASAAIDADIFRSDDGVQSGPLVPFIPLARKYSGRLLLLPHVAADTDHPSRVAGAKQAVDQIVTALRERRASNLRGDLPEDFSPCGSAS